MTDQQLLDSFEKNAKGDWTCVKPVLLDGTARNDAIMPGVTVTRSDLFCGMNIARELNEADARRTSPAEIKLPTRH